jgi:eukaryotic-like serine/threonine-protein kinase
MSSEPNPPDPADRRVGTVINGKWTIERLIGQGGMAVVYAAKHRNRKRAAIKMLLSELSANSAIRERFLREGYVANSVGHVGAVRVDDDDVTEDGAAYLVMELLEGETVHARCERSSCRLALDVAVAIAAQLLDVLQAAHAVGVVHRDLKPDNLYLTRVGTLKVLDFGIARLRELGQSDRATQTGSIMGTPAFMAPEQARGRWERVDARTDLWAVGALLFTLVTGRQVHQAETANETLALACIQRAAPIRSVDPTIPEPVADVIDRALSYESAARFQDAGTMRQALLDAWRAVNGDLPLPSLAVEGHGSPLSPETPANPTPVGDARQPAAEHRVPSVNEISRQPTELTAAVSNNIEQRPRQRTRLITAVAMVAAIIAAVVGWTILHSDAASDAGRTAGSTAPPPSNASALGSDQRSASGSTTVAAPIALSPDELSDASSIDAGARRQRGKADGTRRAASRPQHAFQFPAGAKSTDPMSLRR